MNHFSYHDSAARSSTTVPQPGWFLHRSRVCLLPSRRGNTRLRLRTGSSAVGGHSQASPRSSRPQDAARAPGQHQTTLCTTLSCSLMNQSVINTQRLFRFAGLMLNIHVKEQKHSECKCLPSSERRGHIYILIVENYKANRSRRIAPPLLRHAADCAQAAPRAAERGCSQRPSRYFFV